MHGQDEEFRFATSRKIIVKIRMRVNTGIVKKKISGIKTKTYHVEILFLQRCNSKTTVKFVMWKRPVLSV